MAGPGEEMAASVAGRRPMRASDADREQVIEALKDAFVHSRMTKDELDARAGRALAARTCAELAALTADIPPVPAASGPIRPLAPPRPRPLASAVARSGSCLALAAVAVCASVILDPGGPGVDRPWAGLMLLVAQYAVIAGVWILWSGVASSMRPRRSGRQVPPRAGPGGYKATWSSPPRSAVACGSWPSRTARLRPGHDRMRHLCRGRRRCHPVRRRPARWLGGQVPASRCPAALVPPPAADGADTASVRWA